MLLLIDAVSIFPVRKVLFWTVPIMQLLYYKTKDLPELHALQCTNAHPLEAFECFLSLLRYSPGISLLLPKHAYTQMKTKGGISQGTAEQHAAGKTV